MERKNSQSNSNRDGLLLRSEVSTTSSEFVLQWGNRKKLRCMKVQAKEPNNPVHRVTSRVDRRSNSNNNSKDSISNQKTNNNSSFKSGFGYLNLRHRPASTSPRILRNTEGNSIGMRGHTNGVRGLASKATSTINNTNTNTKNNNNTNHHHNENHHQGGGSGSSEMAHKGGSPSGGGDAMAGVWPPKFVIGLTNKEKEEDFLAIKGSKLPQRPKKRAKFIQRTLNLVSPGAWLCDLTLDRYEVREKKVSKKRARGLKGMGNMESESE